MCVRVFFFFFYFLAEVFVLLGLSDQVLYPCLGIRSQPLFRFEMSAKIAVTVSPLSKKAAPWATFLSKPAEGKMAARSKLFPVEGGVVGPAARLSSGSSQRGWHLGGCSGEKSLEPATALWKLRPMQRNGHQLGWWDSGGCPISLAAVKRDKHTLFFLQEESLVKL